MRIKFWGTRGSIPTPGPETVKYGGNTTCIEVETDSGDLIILDAGSGIRPLGLELMKNLPLDCSIFISHTHWDHIQGLPFFIPLFVQGNRVNIHGAFDPVSMKDIKDILEVQMEYRYFPVRSAELKAEILYETMIEGQALDVGSAKVTSILLNHPVLDFGYKVEADGKSVFFTGDHEHWCNIYKPGDDYYDEYQSLIDAKQQHLADFIRGVDVLVADSQYTNDEYPPKIGWGHSTFDRCVDLARAAEVKHLYLTHHEPTRTDEALDEIQAGLRSRNKDAGFDINIAREGDEIKI